MVHPLLAVVAGRPHRPPPRRWASLAEVWQARAERAVRRVRRTAGRHPELAGTADEAERVLTELRSCCRRIALLDRALGAAPLPRWRAERDRLAGALAAQPPGETSEHLRSAHATLVDRLADCARQRAARDALLVRVRTGVAGLERAGSRGNGSGLPELRARLRSSGGWGHRLVPGGSAQPAHRAGAPTLRSTRRMEAAAPTRLRGHPGMSRVRWNHRARPDTM